jgi:hypothetical protein
MSNKKNNKKNPSFFPYFITKADLYSPVQSVIHVSIRGKKCYFKKKEKKNYVETINVGSFNVKMSPVLKVTN